jgi:2-polyprenyl-3-methyl-5-hydroxy-6-metoxy-1,4-benzoquinol methylase
VHDHDWDEFADGWDEAPGTRVYAEGAYRSLLDTLDTRGLMLDGVRVLDFGCGTGLLTEFLVGRVASIAGVDISPRMRDVFASKVRERGWENVTVHADLPDGEFDLIVCSSVLGFLDDYTATVIQLAGLLAPGGVLVHWDWARDEEHPSDGGLTLEEIRSALTEAGLVGVEVGVGFEASVEGTEMRPLMGAAQRPPTP